MRRFFKWAVGLLLGLVIFVVAGLFILNKTLPQEKIKPLLEKAFSTFLLRNLTMEEVSWSFFPAPTLVGKNVRLWEDPDHVLVFSPRVEIDLSLRKLKENLLEIQEIRFINGTGTLRRRADGSIPLKEMINEIRAALQQRAQNPPKKYRLSFREFVVKNSTFQIIDEKLRKSPLSFTIEANGHGDIQGQRGARAFPFELTLNIKTPTDSSKAFLRGTLSRTPDVYFESDNLSVQVARDYYPFIRNIDSALMIDGFLKKSKQKTSIQSSVRSQFIKSRQEPDFPDVTVSASLSNEEPSKLHLSVQDKESEVNADFTFHNEASRRMSSKIQSPSMVVEDVISWVQVFKRIFGEPRKTPAQQALRKPWVIDAEMNLNRVSFRKEIFTNVKLMARQTSAGSIVADKIQGSGLDGHFNATLKLAGDFFPQDYSLQWDIRDVDMYRLMDLTRTKFKLSGKGSAMGHLQGNLAQMKWLGTNGVVSLEVNNGNLMNAPGLFNTFSKLNLKSLLKKFDGKGEMGLPFRVAKVKLFLDDGKISIHDPGVLESATVQVALQGTANLNNKTVDGKVVIHFLTVIDELLGSVPGLRYVVLGKKKSFIPIFVDVKGDLENPEIKVQKQKTISSPVLSAFGRVLSLPADILKKIGSASE